MSQIVNMSSLTRLTCVRLLSPKILSRSCTSGPLEPRKPDDAEVAKTKIPKSEMLKTLEFTDIPTHTGHTFEPDDYRLVRFIGKEKLVNPRFAIDLIAEVPPMAVAGRSTYCDGGDGPLGHPRVYINLDQPGNHACGYCGLRFYQDHGCHDHH